MTWTVLFKYLFILIYFSLHLQFVPTSILYLAGFASSLYKTPFHHLQWFPCRPLGAQPKAPWPGKQKPGTVCNTTTSTFTFWLTDLLPQTYPGQATSPKENVLGLWLIAETNMNQEACCNTVDRVQRATTCTLTSRVYYKHETWCHRPCHGLESLVVHTWPLDEESAAAPILHHCLLHFNIYTHTVFWPAMKMCSTPSCQSLKCVIFPPYSTKVYTTRPKINAAHTHAHNCFNSSCLQGAA